MVNTIVEDLVITDEFLDGLEKRVKEDNHKARLSRQKPKYRFEETREEVLPVEHKRAAPWRTRTGWQLWEIDLLSYHRDLIITDEFIVWLSSQVKESNRKARFHQQKPPGEKVPYDLILYPSELSELNISLRQSLIHWQKLDEISEGDELGIKKLLEQTQIQSRRLYKERKAKGLPW